MKKIVINTLIFVLLINFNVVFAQEETSTTTDSTSTTTEEVINEAAQVTLNIKNGSEIIFEGDVEINNSTSTIIDNTSTEHTIINNNVLSVLNSADIQDENFIISDLQYYSSFDSFLVNCIEFQSEQLCYNWQFVVDGVYPFVGIDDFILEGGETIYFYFGQPRRLVLPDSATSTVEFQIDAEEYNYINDTWSDLSGYTVGIFQDDPENPWTPIVFATSSLNNSGNANFVIEEPGDYKAGLSEDYYYPFYNLTINGNLLSGTTTDSTSTTTATTTDSTATSTSTTTDQTNNSGGGGGLISSSNEFDIDDAIGYLISVQNSNGSFGADLYTDWVAIAFSSVGESNSDLKSYIENDSVSDDLYEKLRRSMALLALGIDPQRDYEENLIQIIINEFDGEQIGDSDLFNDDIFALIVLQNVGYDIDDKIINSIIDFILSKQSNSGSWEGIDLTAAAIQSLKEFEDYSGVSDAISDAKNYLEDRQNSDGSWTNSYATSWVMLAMTSLGYDFDDWQGEPLEYLGELQADDGGLLEDDTQENRIWSTAYAIAAASEEDWISILDDFSKLSSSQNNSDDDDSENKTLTNDGGRSGENENEEDEIEDENTENTDEESESNQTTFEELYEQIIGQQENEGEFINNFSFISEQTDTSTTTKKESQSSTSTIEINNETNENEDKLDGQLAAVSGSNNFNQVIYFVLGIIALIISVIMFRK